MACRMLGGDFTKFMDNKMKTDSCLGAKKFLKSLYSFIIRLIFHGCFKDASCTWV